VTDNMPDDIEEQLRAVLRARAGVPTASGDPVASVQQRMRRRSVRRGIAAGTTAAVCVAGIAIGATALAGNNTSSRPIGPAPVSSTPAPTTSPAPSESPSSQATSVAPTSAPPSAPVSEAVAPSPAPPLPPNVSALSLPADDTFYGVSTGSGQLLVTGIVTTSQDPPCVSVPVDPRALTLGTVTTGSCDDPASSGDRVYASSGDRVYFVVNNPDGGSTAFTSSIVIVTTNPTTGRSTTGPTVMRFSEASDTRPVAAYGGGWLWVYDVDTSNGPEVLQVSATTGQVEDVVRTPELYRPVLAANSDGLWMGNSIEGVQLSGAVFHVAPGSHVVTTVHSSGADNDIVDWMVADNGHVWAGIRRAGSSLLNLWRFDGPTGKVAVDGPEPSLEVGPNFVVGNEQDGLWLTTPDPPFGDTTSPTENQHLDVVRLDPDTGKPTVEAQLPPLDQVAAESGTTPETAAFFAGSYFLLQSPATGGSTDDFTQLLRITPLP
jgi:hypothetical protein